MGNFKVHLMLNVRVARIRCGWSMRALVLALKRQEPRTGTEGIPQRPDSQLGFGRPILGSPVAQFRLGNLIIPSQISTNPGGPAVGTEVGAKFKFMQTARFYEFSGECLGLAMVFVH